LMGCAELLDGLARADLWLADGTFKVVPNINMFTIKRRQIKCRAVICHCD